MSAKNILLVEGEGDKGFFEILCHAFGVSIEVRVATPKDLVDGNRNSKQGAFNLLPTLLKQLEDGQTERIAIVVDADSQSNGGGFENTLKDLEKRLTPFGYQLTENQTAGLIFCHNDGFADFGAWIMPNNADEGMLEDWIKKCLHTNEDGLFQYVKNSIDNIPNGPKFKPLHRSKAEIATWLAWQKKPGHGLYAACEGHLLDEQAPLYVELIAWLHLVFKA